MLPDNNPDGTDCLISQHPGSSPRCRRFGWTLSVGGESLLGLSFLREKD